MFKAQVISMKLILIFSLTSLIIKSVSSKGEFYDSSSQVCCDGTLYKYAQPVQDFSFSCCNSTLIQYPISQSANAPLCCNGRVFNRSEASSSCCGSQIYSTNDKKVACYYDRIIAIPQTSQLKNETQICGADANNYKLYNSQKSVCCSGTLYGVRENFKCCGSYQYDSRSSVCCDEKDVVFIGESAKNYDRCCGSQPYESRKEYCCTQYSDNPYVLTGYSLYPINKLNPYAYTCCGLFQMKNDRTQVCCPSGPKEAFGADSCCGDDLIYESKNEFCYNGMKQIRGQIYDCNGQSYNNSVQICYKNRVYKIDNNIDVCSVNGQEVIYYTTEQGCTKNGLVDKPAALLGKPHLYCTPWAESGYTYYIGR